MKYNAKGHKRKSIRLRGYDYSQHGMYFVTVCTSDKKCNLGKIMNDDMKLNKYGHIVEKELLKSNIIRKEICINNYVIMPNHLHIIVSIVGADGRSPLQQYTTFRMKPKSLSSFVSGFKSKVTKQINILRKTPGTPFWQRNYYEHIIRNEKKLNEIREYIINNPLKWLLDRENPDRKGSDKLEDEIFSSKGE
jgi:REP element-mobilizing transposase RayT|tara:strand:- start:241 stop:816 length:576 start_codon:yes stop_codon:yes gene_type:complete